MPQSFAASDYHSFGIDLGVGWAGRFGMAGGAFRYYPASWIDFNVYTGVDSLGLVTTGGANIYFASMDSKMCLLFFTCKSRFYLGFGGGQIKGGELTVKKDGLEAKFDQSDGGIFLVGLGSREVFPSGFNSGLEVGYRSFSKDPTLTYKSGSTDPSLIEERKKAWNDSIFVAVTFGWEFL